MSLENLEPTLEPTMFRSLKTLALQYKKRLFATFGLVAAENLLLLIYPLVGSFAVNAVLNGQLVSALAYVLMVLIIWVWGRLAVRWTRELSRVFTRNLPYP
ncbi:hypothetical protein BBH51_05415 [Aggregatibacter actinomycetemcomitans]|uniref:ABC transmembrane type-1 domain-containing protein n=1 Tax=Aggregatibacter actinomycetemcomitans TaxID=714 RepID=A0AAC8XYP4_AGGAC|nr:ABC transporter six-transmembrane domain-containing protein [Aggregatibacter actinomycetemcomitans]ANN81643.1 membrane protein [Aggregatibacter actinomycetemcomitans D7S-1]KYK95353.1 membrane protein [Aggregatibacter actinomycetemcomitans serotype d str. SA3733]AMQ94018.1 hypothetical protein ACT75_05500 [Aggregatibacter actinomycetemcomitans]ANU82132.1 hypothetical protein BBH51_05415 [Aggregatibacter actinomycetemcomitans]EKX98972.1 hypothetical protein HMPREF9996_00090 [Aggregatibacter a